MTSVIKHYRNLLKLNSEFFNKLEKDPISLSMFTSAHNFSSDYEKLYEIIEDKPESQLLRLSIREYQFALFAASTSNYRHAYMSLRLAFELALGSILFSAHELHLREWQKNSRHIVWDSLVDPSTGVFAVNFIRAFTPELDSFGVQYAAIARTVYRECSEYVHGNLHTHRNPDEKMDFSSTELQAWAQKASSVHLAIIFAFTGRYFDALPSKKLLLIEGIILERLGEIPFLRAVYQELGKKQ